MNAQRIEIGLITSQQQQIRRSSRQKLQVYDAFYLLPLLLLLPLGMLPLLFGWPPPIKEPIAAARAAVKLGSAVSAFTVSASEFCCDDI